MQIDVSPLLFPLWKNLSVEEVRDKARETEPTTFEVIRRMFAETKVKEQPIQTATAILSIADIYLREILEKACDKAHRQYHIPYYKIIFLLQERRYEKMNTELKRILSVLELSDLARIIAVQEKHIWHAPLAWKYADRLTGYCI